MHFIRLILAMLVILPAAYALLGPALGTVALYTLAGLTLVVLPLFVLIAGAVTFIRSLTSPNP